MKKQYFLIELRNRGLLDELLPALNWLLMDECFKESEVWQKPTVSRFTKQFKAHIGFKSCDFQYKGGLKYMKSPTSRKSPLVMMSKGSSEGRGLVRHLRNSIAHGHARLYGSDDSEWYIEFLDFKHGWQHYRGSQDQTACIVLPLSCFQYIHECYLTIARAARKKNRRR